MINSSLANRQFLSYLTSMGMMNIHLAKYRQVVKIYAKVPVRSNTPPKLPVSGFRIISGESTHLAFVRP
jgi:hypothetical protein